MEIYLPIAQMSVNWGVILVMGVAVGALSGLLGVSGGFLMTPLLIFYGIPPSVAVATQPSPIAAASLMGALNQRTRHGVDFAMGLTLLSGGLVGSAIGVYIFRALDRLGQIGFVIDVSYVLLLGSIGGLMLNESLHAVRAARKGEPVRARQSGQKNWMHNLPFKVRFRNAGLYISVIPVIALGLFVGILTAILGTGGAFLLVPAKVYLLGMRTNIAVGTSQFQMFCVAVMTTLFHSVTDRAVDIVLAFLLVLGSVIGARMGVHFGAKLRGEEIRAVFALLIVGIAIRLFVGFIVTPNHLYSVAIS